MRPNHIFSPPRRSRRFPLALAAAAKGQVGGPLRRYQLPSGFRRSFSSNRSFSSLAKSCSAGALSQSRAAWHVNTGIKLTVPCTLVGWLISSGLRETKADVKRIGRVERSKCIVWHRPIDTGRDLTLEFVVPVQTLAAKRDKFPTETKLRPYGEAAGSEVISNHPH